jgi:hypothetical protein
VCAKRPRAKLTKERVVGGSWLVVFVCAVALAASGVAAQAPPAPAAGIQRVAWLQGCWEMAAGTRTVEEQWMAPRGGTMMGISRTVRDGRLLEYEFVVLREQGEGLVYEPRPSGQAPASFPSRTIDTSSIVFENPQHDFPTIIGYRRESADAVLAWIEGTVQGKARRIEFKYARVPCPGAR